MTLGKYAQIVLGLCISSILIVVTGISINVIYANDRANVSHHILTRLQATTGIINLWEQEYLMSVRSVAQDPGLGDLIDKLLTHQITTEQATATMDEWLRPIYLGRGYEGHSIITADHKIILASSPAFVGKQVSTESSREAIDRAFKDGASVARPSEAAYQVRMLDRIAEAGTLYQLGCAQIKKQGQVLAVLCLRQDPYRNFFPMLSSGFSGETGEAYAVDRNGNIVSPTRFGHDVFRRPQKDLSTYIKGLQARVPTRTRSGEYLVTNKSPLTRGVREALENGESGFLYSYQDYRNVTVAGAVKWLPETDMGIVVEQDASEVYGPFQLARNAIIGLGILAIILTNTLIIAQVRSRKSLALREAHMRAFLNNFPGFAHMRSPEGKFILVNNNMEKYLGLTRSQMTNGDADVLPFPPKSIQQINNEHETVVNTGTVIEKIMQVGEVYAIDDIDWVKVVRFPVFESDSKTIHAVGTIMLDISEQMHNAQALEKLSQHLEETVSQRTAQFEIAKQEAEQATRAKADFLANMSHEIRTPMNAIIGLSHLATMVSDDPKLRSYLQRIHQSSSHLLSIVNDILDFSKIEAGKMTIEHADFSLEDMLDKVIGLLWEKADDKGLELLLQIDTDIPDSLNGDALRIGQVLINLLSNAVKFTEAGDVILRVRKISDDHNNIRIRFDVRDTGIGIEPNRFNQLFKPFHQLDTSSTRRFEGTGLGLTISKNLVELMNGQLDFVSKPGEGSTFSLEITLAKSSLQEPEKVAAMHSQDCRVLVVDDNRNARNILTQMLSRMGLTLCEADSGLAALDMIHKHEDLGESFDIVFLDWKMPGISGVETAERINALELKMQPKLVLVSAHSKQDMGSNLENLIDSVLTKPITPSALYDALGGLVKDAPIKPEPGTPLDINHYQKLAGADVLLVDDNDINQDVVKELLALVQASVSLASNGQEALDKLQEQRFDLVLMDVQMPVMDGIEATRRIRVQPQYADLPIIAMTANALAEDRELCLKVGMSDYVSKPIDPDILFRTMMRWLNQQSVTRRTQTESSSQDNEQDIALSQLENIPGLEIAPALERLLNNKSFYVKLIERFVRERSDITQVIRSALAENNIEEATRQAHTFKSLAGTIGAVKLQEVSLELETALRDGNETAVLLDALDCEVRELNNRLRERLKID